MKLRLIAVGKVREAHLRTAVDDYLGRTRKFHPIEEVEVKGGEGLDRAIPPRWRVVTLEPDGKQLTSTELAAWMGRTMADRAPGIAFIVGGPDGIPQAVSKRANLRLSLSKLTLPHRLARIVLAEQIYRAFTIVRGLPYPR